MPNNCIPEPKGLKPDNVNSPEHQLLYRVLKVKMRAHAFGHPRKDDICDHLGWLRHQTWGFDMMISSRAEKDWRRCGWGTKARKRAVKLGILKTKYGPYPEGKRF